jgi:glycosyltransferase involved in cell wall biosynthesis
LRGYQDQIAGWRSEAFLPLGTILTVHNYYRQRGGEDKAFESESALLESQGHSVVRYENHNKNIQSGIISGLAGVWNQTSYKRLQKLAREHRPGVAHLHNTFPLTSPAAYYALRRVSVPVVQTIENFRLLCPGATLCRDGRVCEQCLERRSLLPALVHRCYRSSAPATAAVVAMLTIHRSVRTWERMVDAYIAPSEFVRRKLVDGGLPADRILVKPNFVAPDPGPGKGTGAYALFVGRLAEEKGIRVIAEAWRRLTGIPLMVAGDGPLYSTTWPADVTSLGAQTHRRVTGLMKEARVLIVPSIWYECAPMTILEAFACGLPVIASDLGAMRELVEDHRTGLLFRPGDPDDLATKVRWAFEHPAELQAMRAAARREFEEKYTAERNYKILINIYEMAIENARRRRSGGIRKGGSGSACSVVGQDDILRAG